jgi:signal peptidase I
MNQAQNNQKRFNGYEVIVIIFLAFLVRTFGYGLYRVPTGSMETTMLVGELFFADKFSVLFSDPLHEDIISFNDPLFEYSDNKLVSLMQSYVWGPTNWTKRIIGVPGDEMRGVVEDGKPVIYRNGKRLDESYLNKYPLIGVWKVDPTSLSQNIDAQSSEEDVWSYKTYDPSKPFDAQPWYSIDADRVRYDERGQPYKREVGTPWIKIDGYANSSQKNFWNGSDVFSIKLEANQFWVMGDNRMNSFDSRSFGPLERKHIHGKIVYRLLSIDTHASWIVAQMVQHPINFCNSIRWNRCMQSVL